MATHDVDGRELFACSRCKMKYTADGFEVDRHGNRRKGCKVCKVRVRALILANHCPHGRERRHCKPCGGSAFCEHGRRRPLCRECSGASICEHGRDRRQCKPCGGSAFCEHGRNRSICKPCGGSSFCSCGIQLKNCFTCDPVRALWERAQVRICDALGTKVRAGRSTAELLGCSNETFFRHIEAQFVDGMSWDRIKEIEIDHRVPIKFGNPTLEEQIARLDYRNCQPLWRWDNRSKKNRYIGRPGEEVYEEPKKWITDQELEELLG